MRSRRFHHPARRVELGPQGRWWSARPGLADARRRDSRYRRGPHASGGVSGRAPLPVSGRAPLPRRSTLDERVVQGAEGVAVHFDSAVHDGGAQPVWLREPRTLPTEYGFVAKPRRGDWGGPDWEHHCPGVAWAQFGGGIRVAEPQDSGRTARKRKTRRNPFFPLLFSSRDFGTRFPKHRPFRDANAAFSLSLSLTPVGRELLQAAAGASMWKLYDEAHGAQSPVRYM